MSVKLSLFGICGVSLGAIFITSGFSWVAFAAEDTPRIIRYTEPIPPESRLTYSPAAVKPQARAEFLKGRIVDDKGQPIAGAKVDVYHWYPGTETTTEKSGAFDLHNTPGKDPIFDPEEKIEVTFSAPGYTPRYIVAQPLGELAQPIVLTKDTYLYGVVRDARGKAVPNAKVRAVAGPFRGDGVSITEVPYVTTSDAQGNYRLPLQGDSYELFVLGSKGNTRLPKKVLIPGKSLQQNFELQPGVTFRAKVVDSLTGKPVPGLHLRSESDFKATSDKNGIIEIANMYKGPFQWDVEGPGLARWWSEAAIHPYERKSYESEEKWQRNLDGLSFEIEPGMKPVTIVAERGVRIKGRVLDPDGKPVAGATVAPALTGTGNSLTGDTRYSVLTDAKGEFEGLYPAGHSREWNLMAHDGDYEKWRHWANVTAPPMKTETGQLITDFTLTLVRPVAVTGQVVDKAGKPVAHAEVRAVQADKRSNRYYDPTTQTDADGRFTLPFVAPGQQFVQVAPFWLNPNEAPTSSSKMMEIKPGKTFDVGILIQIPR